MRTSGSGPVGSLLCAVVVALLAGAAPATGQAAAGAAADTLADAQATAVSQAVPAESAGGLPIFVTAGMGFGQRFDPCAQCPSPDNIESFTAHVSLGKYMVPDLALGVDASVWRRGHPGAPMGADSTTAGTPVALVNQLGNASLVASFETWQVFFRLGVGVAIGRQDVQDDQGVVSTGTGLGVGYTFGAGASVPLVSMVSLAFFLNYNVGSYDLTSPTAVLERDVRHEFLEMGFALTMR